MKASLLQGHKQLWVLAGGNGAGKSTFYRLYLEPLGIHFVNADLIAKQFEPQNPMDFSYQASTLAASLRHELLKNGTCFCFETVFSHPSKIDFVAEAKSQDYEVILIYIHLSHPGLNQARVKQRVSEGGHDVPAGKVVSRIPRTMANIRKTLALVDQARFFDNSYKDDPYQPVATVERGALVSFVEPLPAWASDMLSELLVPPAPANSAPIPTHLR